MIGLSPVATPHWQQVLNSTQELCGVAIVHSTPLAVSAWTTFGVPQVGHCVEGSAVIEETAVYIHHKTLADVPRISPVMPYPAATVPDCTVHHGMIPYLIK